MNNIEYYEELAIYRLTDYEWSKNMDIQAEKMKEWRVKMLEKIVNRMKENLPEDCCNKMGKLVMLSR